MGQVGHFGAIKFYSKMSKPILKKTVKGNYLELPYSGGKVEALSFSDATWSSSINIAEHKRHGKKPLLEFTSRNADDFTMTIYLWAQLGVSPWKMLNKLRSYTLEAKVYPLYLGGRKAGHNKWIISSVSNELKTFYKNGKPILIVANVTFKEYLSVKEKKKSKHKRVAVKNKKRKKKVAKTSSNKKQNTNSSKSKKASSSKSKKKSVSSKKSGGYITYTLKKTDTLWNLAKKYYGSGDKYKKIYNANKSLQQGYKLKPGSTIRIPKK